MVYRDKHNYDVDGTRVCKTCGERKPIDEFYLTGKADNRRRSCAPCYTAARNAWHLLDKYGLSREDMARLRELQGDACSICGKQFGNEYLTRPQVDHDHSCCPGDKTCGKCIRSLLCVRCNTSIGQFEDNPELLRAAASYLEQNLTPKNGHETILV